MEAERLVAESPLDHFLESDKSSTTDEKNISRVDREELLVRVLATTLRRNIRDSPFEDLQERLLHAFARHVARDRRVLILTTNLANLVDIDDALLRALNVAVRSLQEFENDVLDVFANVARFSQRRCIYDRERNSEHARECLREQRLAGAGRPDQQNVCFLDIDVRAATTKLDAFVVLIDGDRETLLCLFLTDDVFVQEVFDLSGLRKWRASGY